MPAIALTDLDGLYAAIPFYQLCRRAGVKPIMGAEFVIQCGTGFQSVQMIQLTLLAQGMVGYGNLCRLVSLRHLRETHLTLADLTDVADDLICLAGHGADDTPNGSASPCGTPVVARQSNSCGNPFAHASPRDFLPAMLPRLRDIFANRLYVELSIHDQESTANTRRMAMLADELDIPVVASCASRCMHRDDGLMLRALQSIGTLTLLDQPHTEKPAGTWHLRTPEEMRYLFRRRPDALANTLTVAEQCSFDIDLERNRFPPCCAPPGRTAAQHLRALCIAGCQWRYVDTLPQKGMGGKRPTLAEAIARLDRELNIIDQVHYAEYFLVFHEIVQYCRSQGIASLARGSAADSLVCYVLGVSHACPFRFDLPFDRFLNPERAKFSKMADIDLDLPWDQRDQVIRWVFDRWGHDRVAMIGLPNTFHARAAVAELGKVFGLPAHEVHKATRMLPPTAAWNVERAIRLSPEARDFPITEEPYRTMLQLATGFEGLPRHWAMHPCGIVVAPEPLTELIPVQRSPKGHLVAQYDMDAIESLGFIKIDLLGQAGLSVLRDAVASINEERVGLPPSDVGSASSRSFGTGRMPVLHQMTGWKPGPHQTQVPHQMIDLQTDVDYADEATWQMIATGGARGVHHIESPAMTSLIRQCNCRDIDGLTAIVAIIRPGAANQGKKEIYARRHQHFEAPQYVHPSLVPVLEQTYGLMVFEEHILQIATEFAGMNLGLADVLRRGLNKENQKLITESKLEFWKCARSQGRCEEEIAAVWAQVEGFRGFMFNKAHSAEYAVEAFQGAWLKHRWPAHYLAAILSNYRGFYASSPTLPQILYVMEALRLGIGFLPPCANRSGPKFRVEREAGCGTRNPQFGKDEPYVPSYPSPGFARRLIRIPIMHIKGLAEAFITRYLAERERGVFASLDDFLERCGPGESEAISLLDSGALDCFGLPRPFMFWHIRRHVHSGMRGHTLLLQSRGKGFLREQVRAFATPKQLRPCRRNGIPAPASGDAGGDLPPVELTEPDVWQIAQREMELLGFPVTIDPLTFLERSMWDRQDAVPTPCNDIDWSQYLPLNELDRYYGRRVRVCGLMIADRTNLTTEGDLMKFVSLADRTGVVEAFLFPDTYRRFGHLTVAQPILAATAIVEPFENRNGFNLRVEQVAPPARRTG